MITNPCDTCLVNPTCDEACYRLERTFASILIEDFSYFVIANSVRRGYYTFEEVVKELNNDKKSM